jgi:hypothetical protein
MAADTEAGRKQHTQRETTMDFIREAQINFDSLKGNPYPGRGIVIGLSPDGKNIFQIYWIKDAAPTAATAYSSRKPAGT